MAPETTDRFGRQVKDISTEFKQYAENFTRQVIGKERLKVEECKLKAEHFIAENPIKTVAGGLLTGYIIGKLFSGD